MVVTLDLKRVSQAEQELRLGRPGSVGSCNLLSHAAQGCQCHRVTALSPPAHGPGLVSSRCSTAGSLWEPVTPLHTAHPAPSETSGCMKGEWNRSGFISGCIILAAGGVPARSAARQCLSEGKHMLGFHSMCSNEISTPEQMGTLQHSRSVSLWHCYKPGCGTMVYTALHICV